MDQQMTFTDMEHGVAKRKTRRQRFLDRLEGLVPWSELEAVIEPHYPNAGNGRRPYPLGAMLRVHVMQLAWNLSDRDMENFLYETHSARRFAGLGIEALLDETTILNFRRRLERADLGEPLFDRINAVLAERGTRLSTGTLVDASFVEAPSSTKNRKGERDPEMRQGRKGKTWHFGMKAHIGVDAESGLVHSLSTTPANESDVVHAHEVLHGGETDVWGDSGYQGVGKRRPATKSRSPKSMARDIGPIANAASEAGTFPPWKGISDSGLPALSLTRHTNASILSISDPPIVTASESRMDRFE